MAQMGYIENGLKATKKNGSRRKPRTRNGTVKAKAKNPAKRRAISLETAKKIVARNGLKTVSRSVPNGKKRRHKKRGRNGLQTATRRVNNGMLGNTKSEVKRVGGVLGGAAAVAMAGRAVNAILQPYAASVGMGKYSQMGVDLGLAVVVAPMIAKRLGGQALAESVRLGGLLIFGTDLLGLVFPQALTYLPFTTGANSSPLLTPAAVAALADNIKSPSDAAKVAGAMRALEGGASIQQRSVSRTPNFLPAYS